MGNIDTKTIRLRNFEPNSEEEKMERYCIDMAGKYTDGLIESYCNLSESRNGRYINSDLMKMVFPFYASSKENRNRFNLSVSNTAAVLTNETYIRAINDKNVERCIYLVGPYGAGKSFFAQSLFEKEENGILDKAVVYEGSITPPAFEEKVQYAIDHSVIPEIIALNPTFELSLRNIRERAKRIGRDVIKEEVISKFSDFYKNLKSVITRYPRMPYIIYNKESNVSLDLSSGSRNLEDLNKASEEDISRLYDQIIETLKREERIEGLIL